MGESEGVAVGAVGIIAIRSLSASLVAILWRRKLAVLELIGIFSLMDGVLIVSFLSACMGAGVRSMLVGMASFA